MWRLAGASCRRVVFDELPTERPAGMLGVFCSHLKKLGCKLAAVGRRCVHLEHWNGCCGPEVSRVIKNYATFADYQTKFAGDDGGSSAHTQEPMPMPKERFDLFAVRPDSLALSLVATDVSMKKCIKLATRQALPCVARSSWGECLFWVFPSPDSLESFRGAIPASQLRQPAAQARSGKRLVKHRETC